MNKTEQVARWMCQEAGYDPDEVIQNPDWPSSTAVGGYIVLDVAVREKISRWESWRIPAVKFLQLDWEKPVVTHGIPSRTGTDATAISE